MCVKSVDDRNLKFCISVNEEADWAARVSKRLSGIQEYEAASGRFFGNNCGA